jgi:hypothetical protein
MGEIIAGRDSTACVSEAKRIEADVSSGKKSRSLAGYGCNQRKSNLA